MQTDCPRSPPFSRMRKTLCWTSWTSKTLHLKKTKTNRKTSRKTSRKTRTRT